MQFTTRWAATGLLAIVIFGLAVGHFSSKRGGATPSRQTATFAVGTVVYVTDGDTINVQGAGPVRFIGIDAPETKDHGKKKKGCYGETAKKQLTQLLPPGTPVELVTEGKRTRDKYGRVLAYVEKGGEDIGETMMRLGMVDFYTEKRNGKEIVVPFGRQARYEAAWGDAEWASAGIHNPACAP